MEPLRTGAGEGTGASPRGRERTFAALARAMRVRAYICVQRMETVPKQKESNKKKKRTHREEGGGAGGGSGGTEGSGTLAPEGDPRARLLNPLLPRPPPPSCSIGRLIFYSGRSRICIRSGAPAAPLSLSLSSFGTRASVRDIIRIILLPGGEGGIPPLSDSRGAACLTFAEFKGAAPDPRVILYAI
jgi:hypothetical protein